MSGSAARSRQGKDFSLQLDLIILLVGAGEITEPGVEAHYGPFPLRTDQDAIRISQSDWTHVLERWDRCVGLLLPLAVVEPDLQRAKIDRYVKEDRQKFDGADDADSVATSCKAQEILREPGPLTTLVPNGSRDRHVLQRIRVDQSRRRGTRGRPPVMRKR